MVQESGVQAQESGCPSSLAQCLGTQPSLQNCVSGPKDIHSSLTVPLPGQCSTSWPQQAPLAVSRPGFWVCKAGKGQIQAQGMLGKKRGRPIRLEAEMAGG